MRERIYLLSIISLIFLVWGCGEDPDADIAPKVVSVSVSEGMVNPHEIVATFNKDMKSVKIDVSGYEYATTVFGVTDKIAQWKQLPHEIACGNKTIEVIEPISPGMHTLTVTGVDKYGNKLEEFTPINFEIVPPD